MTVMLTISTLGQCHFCKAQISCPDGEWISSFAAIKTGNIFLISSKNAPIAVDIFPPIITIRKVSAAIIA